MPETKGLEVGFEGGKLVRGRKRSIVVDTMGYVICAMGVEQHTKWKSGDDFA